MKRTLLVLTACLLAGCATQQSPQRFGSITGLKPEKAEYYRALHADPWPTINKMIKECHIGNYSIYLRQLDDGNHYLFSYFEYTGADFAADMARMAAAETTQKWWEKCKPCQQPLPDIAPGQWWADAEEVFHCD